MCGIFGIILNDNWKGGERDDFLREAAALLFELSSARGKDASGIASIGNGIRVLKDFSHPSKFIKSESYRDLMDRAKTGQAFAVLGHARMATNGLSDLNDCQPVVKSGAIAVHNGIITNVDSLWEEYGFLDRKYQVDTEIIASLVGHFRGQGNGVIGSFFRAASLFEGSFALAMAFDDSQKILLATNTGSLYELKDNDGKFFIFASERYILESFSKKIGLEKIAGPVSTRRLEPFFCKTVEIGTLKEVVSGRMFAPPKGDGDSGNIQKKPIIDCSGGKKRKNASAEFFAANTNKIFSVTGLPPAAVKIESLKRCSRCLLPETMPFVEFDARGICNYCKNYRPAKMKKESDLEELVRAGAGSGAEPNCLVTFSGGRDSSYGLHYVKRVLKLNPVAYSYDWGMITDLGRRNQARLCGKLGVEHILVSADLAKKRENIRKNVAAWLKKPDLGAVPLFMAGDKQYFYYANQLKKRLGVKTVFLCANPLEKTDFKSGFCGIKPVDNSIAFYRLGMLGKISLAFYYLKQFAANPAYLNSSLADTGLAFLSYYFLEHDYVNLYEYVKWDEKQTDELLKKEYDWEFAPDTKSSWRIGDGTAAFYNYIYYTVAGFTENDTFRSNQIREGMIGREEALRLVNEENRPRFESIKWYCDTIRIDFNDTIKIINSIPKKY